MRVTLDSSVLVAAHISRAGVCAELLEEVLLSHELVLSDYILGELRKKLLEKFAFPEEFVEAAVSKLGRAAEVLEPAPVASGTCRDREDLPILGTATAGRSDVLVTVDKDLLALGSHKGIDIIKPGDFWRRVRSQ